MSKSSRLVRCLIAIVVVTLGSACDRSPKPGRSGGTPSQVAPDQKALDDLRAAGSDLSRIHAIEFYLHVPSEQDAKAAAKTLQERDFNTVVREEAHGRWLCLGQKSLTPTMEHLTGVRGLFESLAAQYGGKYDGWKAGVQP